MRILVHLLHNETITIESQTEQSLAQALWLSGKIAPVPLCSGLGRCALCKARFISPAPPALDKEKKILSTLCDAGWRLTCKHMLHTLQCNENGMIEIVLPETTYTHTTQKNVVFHHAATLPKHSTTTENIFLAVDVGTTSLHWRAIHSHGACIAQGQCINPQMGAGSDIMSRIAAATQPHIATTLADLIHTRLREICHTLPPVSALCLAANTAMTAIFLQKNVHSLASAPYTLPYAGNSTEHLPHLPPIYIPPQLAPFVGGDISAGYASLVHGTEKPFPFLLADMGTNGEFVLAIHPQKAYIASVPMGPALEGIGLNFGTMADSSAGKGIVCAVSLTPQGISPTTLDGSPPQNICGTGYLSLIDTLLRVGIIDNMGHFCPTQSNASPLIRKLTAKLTTKDDENIFSLWPLPHYAHKATQTLPTLHNNTEEYIYISATDVEKILQVKAAFSLAIQELLHTADINAADLKHIYIAGAMGSHCPPHILERLGFVPQGMGTRIVSIGNAALDGAQTLLLHPEARHTLTTWSKHCTHVSLTENIQQKFLRHMQFAYTE